MQEATRNSQSASSASNRTEPKARPLTVVVREMDGDFNLLAHAAITPVHSAPQPVRRETGCPTDTIDEVAMPKARNQTVKRVVDVLGAISLFVAFLPLMLPIVIIRAFSAGPIIYGQRRIGQNGKVFRCLKFRTMVPHADRVLHELLKRHPELKVEWLRDHKLKNDPRVTAIGSFLRRTSLDELPQLWNVLRGDMSLVGPRPVVREELRRYGRSASAYLSAKPGLTGLWQVSGRNDMSYRRRVAIDVYYVRNGSLLLDLYILLRTVRVILFGGGAY